jgi:hypothetical protein
MLVYLRYKNPDHETLRRSLKGGVLMPAASALILTSRAGGRGALRALFSRLALWRVNMLGGLKQGRI